MNNTAKQLVEKLGNNAEITIMADVVHGLDFEYDQLQQENKELKETLKGTTHCFDEEEHKKLLEENEKLKLYQVIPTSYFDPIGEKGVPGTVTEEYIEQIQRENEDLKRYCCKRNNCGGRLKVNHKPTDNEVLTEFEKWLEKEINKITKMNIDISNPIHSDIVYSKIELKRCLDKLQELKGSNNEKI